MQRAIHQRLGHRVERGAGHHSLGGDIPIEAGERERAFGGGA